MIGKMIAAREIDRMSGLEYFSTLKPSALDELVKALTYAANEVVAVGIVNEILTERRDRPTPADIYAAVSSHNETQRAAAEPEMNRPVYRCERCQDSGLCGGNLGGPEAGEWKACSCPAGNNPKLYDAITEANQARKKILRSQQSRFTPGNGIRGYGARYAGRKRLPPASDRHHTDGWFSGAGTMSRPTNPQAMAAVSTRQEYTGSADLGQQVDGDTWLTPRWILDQLGFFDLDPCAASPNLKWCAPRFWTKEDDGLGRTWFGRVFMNPPFSNTAVWRNRHAAHGNGISLVPASVESLVWAELVWKHAKAILFLAGRTRFANPDGSSTTGRPLRSVALIAWSDYDKAILERCSIAGVLLRDWKQSGIPKPETALEVESTRDAIARCSAEQKQASALIHTPEGKLWAEDWVKEEVLIRLQSGCCVTDFTALPPASVEETRG